MPPLGAASRGPADLGCFLGPPPRPPPRPTCCFLILLMCLPPAEGRSPWRFGGGVPGASASLAGAPRDPSRVVCRREGSWLEAGIHTHVLQGGEGFLKERFHQHLLGSRLISEPTAQESWHCDPPGTCSESSPSLSHFIRPLGLGDPPTSRGREAGSPQIAAR